MSGTPMTEPYPRPAWALLQEQHSMCCLSKTSRVAVGILHFFDAWSCVLPMGSVRIGVCKLTYALHWLRDKYHGCTYLWYKLFSEPYSSLVKVVTQLRSLDSDVHFLVYRLVYRYALSPSVATNADGCSVLSRQCWEKALENCQPSCPTRCLGRVDTVCTDAYMEGVLCLLRELG